MANRLCEDLQETADKTRLGVWPNGLDKTLGVESYPGNVAEVVGCRELRRLAVIVEPNREGWKSTTFRAAPLWAAGATRQITAETQAVWLVKPLRASLAKYVSDKATGANIFWDYLDSYPTASVDPSALVVDSRFKDEVVFVGCTPLACATSNYSRTAFIPHHGDNRFAGSVYCSEGQLGYHGEASYVRDLAITLDQLGLSINYKPLASGARHLSLSGMLCLRGGNYATKANAVLKPQMKFANAVIAGVPFFTSDTPAAKSLADYYGIGSQTIDLSQIKGAVRSHSSTKAPLYLITGSL